MSSSMLERRKSQPETAGALKEHTGLEKALFAFNDAARVLAFQRLGLSPLSNGHWSGTTPAGRQQSAEIGYGPGALIETVTASGETIRTVAAADGGPVRRLFIGDPDVLPIPGSRQAHMRQSSAPANFGRVFDDIKRRTFLIAESTHGSLEMKAAAPYMEKRLNGRREQLVDALAELELAGREALKRDDTVRHGDARRIVDYTLGHFRYPELKEAVDARVAEIEHLAPKWFPD